MTSVSAKQFIVAMANRIVIVERADLIIDVLKQPRRQEREPSPARSGCDQDGTLRFLQGVPRSRTCCEPGTARAPVAVADKMDDCESKNFITTNSFRLNHH